MYGDGTDRNNNCGGCGVTILYFRKQLKVGFSRINEHECAAISMVMDVPHGSELYWLNNSVHNAQTPK